jgi:hypothetical protein
MPTKNPRINVVLDKTLYKSVRSLARKDRVSLSTKVRDLLKEALELHEDLYLVAIAEQREKSLGEDSTLSHEEVWS